jgi:PAS domain S-box-containing protein
MHDATPETRNPAIDRLLHTADLKVFDLTLASQAIAIAVFKLNGDLSYANPGMEWLLDLDSHTSPPAERLINPDFAYLCQLAQRGANPVFTGIMTLGHPTRRTGSIKARVVLADERLLIFGEHDVAELGRLNRKLAEANRDNNNLQRQLIKDKKRLKMTLDQLHASEAKYRRLFESAVLGIMQSTPDGRIINLNAAFAAMFGYASADEMLAAVKDVATDLYAEPQKRPEIIKTLLSGDLPVNIENRYRRKDGSIFVGNMHKWAVHDEDGKFLYLEGFVEDIDQRKKMERRLIQARKMEAVAALAGGVAHEFNNALTGLMGNLELLGMENDIAPTSRDHYEAIKRTCFRMSGLAEKLLAYARGGKYRTKELTLSQALDQAEESMRDVLADGVDLEMRIGGQYQVALDPVQFHFIVRSLLINAVEAVDGQGQIRIGTRDEDLSDADAVAWHESFPAGCYASLEIVDNGHGMDAETRQRVFDPFFSTRFPGRGLSMAAVYGIVKNHGGWIFVSSQLQIGTTVKIFFPAVANT